MLIDALPFIVAVALFVAAVRWPWWGIVALLAVLPLNGFIVLVLGDLLGLEGLPRIALAAWHDALVAGAVVAAVVALTRTPRGRRPRMQAVEWLVLAVLALGAVYVLVAPYRLTALYAYRTLYEPIVLLVAITVLAACSGMPERFPRAAGLAIVAGGVVAALAAWPQVYLGGFAYLDNFYHEAGERLSPAYTATAIAQPRAVGTFTSPNELGAYLAIVVGALALSRITGLTATSRAWLLVPVATALLLSFSRSGWVTTLVILAVIALLSFRETRAEGVRERLAGRSRWLRSFGPPAVTVVVLLVLIASSSRAPEFVGSTVTGNDPSAGARPGSAAQGVTVITADPLGVGLGMAGPKSVRFGEIGDRPVLASETWYVAYAMQVGIAGLALLLILVVAVARELLRRPHRSWPILALAVGAGLGTGALFIPIIDDPAVATPLCAIAGIALALVRARATTGFAGRAATLAAAAGVDGAGAADATGAAA